MTTDDTRRRRRELIELAEQIARAPLPEPRTPLALAAGLAVVGVVSIGAGVKMASGTSSPATTAPAAPAAAPVVVATPPTSVAPGTHIAVPGQPTHWVVFADGSFHLRGAVADASTGQALETKVGGLLGAGRVVVEYTVDPSTPAPSPTQTDDLPVFVPNAAGFSSGSSELSAQAQSELRLTWGLLGRGRDASVEIHSDPRSANLMLDAARVDAVRRWFLDAGLAPGQVTVAAAPPYGAAVVADDPDSVDITVHGTFG